MGLVPPSLPCEEEWVMSEPKREPAANKNELLLLAIRHS